jgi:hypothetical protein
MNDSDKITHLGKSIEVIYHMDKIVWQAIRSCFGRGFWINTSPWNNEEAWNN